MGPVIVSFANRQCYAGAMVLGNQALLGAIPMEDMDLVVLPGTRQVEVNPPTRTSPARWRWNLPALEASPRERAICSRTALKSANLP